MEEQDTFVEEFFDSHLYKEFLARNDQKGAYVVRTQSDSVYLLDKTTSSCTQLHFQEEIDNAIKDVNS